MSSLAPVQSKFKTQPLFGQFVFLALLTNTLLFCDPSDTNFGFGFSVGYVPVLLTIIGLLSYILRENPTLIDAKFSRLDLILLTFVSISFFGSFAYSQQHPEFHFMRLGLLAISYFVLKPMFKSYSFAKRFERHFGSMLIFAGLFLVATLVFWRLGFVQSINSQNQNLYHEEVFILAALPFVAKNLTYKRILLVLAVLGCLLTLKNTGFILAVITVVAYIFTQNRRHSVIIAKLLIFLISLFVLAPLIFAWFGNDLPSGNIETRSVTYGLRLTQFWDSPIFGNLFQMHNSIDVGWGRVFSHSDILDVLAGSGVVGLSLLAVPVVVLLCATSPYQALPFKMLVIGFMTVAVFNPVMMNPKTAFVFWLSMAFLSAGAQNSGARNG